MGYCGASGFPIESHHKDLPVNLLLVIALLASVVPSTASVNSSPMLDHASASDKPVTEQAPLERDKGMERLSVIVGMDVCKSHPADSVWVRFDTKWASLSCPAFMNAINTARQELKHQ
jgi:hypothetical protein